jgi:hypothetical protein
MKWSGSDVTEGEATLLLYIYDVIDPTHAHATMFCPSFSKKKENSLIKHVLIRLNLHKICLLQSTPFYSLYTVSKLFFQFWNASWSSFCWITRRSRRAYSFIFSVFWNRRPCRVDFNLENKKNAEAKYGEWDVWAMTVISRSANNSSRRNDVWSCAVSRFSILVLFLHCAGLFLLSGYFNI